MGKFSERLSQRVADKKLIKASMKESTMPDQQPQNTQQPKPQPKNILERVTALEGEVDGVKQGIGQLVGSLDPILGEMKTAEANLAEVTDALVELFGKESVMAKIAEQRQKGADEKVAAEKRGLEKLLADGAVERVEEAGPGCFIIGMERDKDGNPVMTPGYRAPTGYHQRFFEGYNKEAQEAIKGQKIGFVRKDEKTESTFVIEGIYRFVQKEPSAEAGEQDLEEPSATEEAPAEAAPVEA